MTESAWLLLPSGQRAAGDFIDDTLVLRAREKGLDHRLTSLGEFPRQRVEVIRGPDLEARINELYYRRGWTDGLPIVAPTLERVNAALQTLSLPRDATLGELDPLDAFRDTAPARAMTLAKVKWPSDVDPDSTCLVEVEVVEDGSPSAIAWLACPEDLRSYVDSAIEASWFSPGRKKGRSVPGVVRLRYTPSSATPRATLEAAPHSSTGSEVPPGDVAPSGDSPGDVR